MVNKYFLFGRGTLNGNTCFFYVKSESAVKELPSPNFIEKYSNPLLYPHDSKWKLMNKIEPQDIVRTCFYDHITSSWIQASDVHKYDHSGLRSNHNGTMIDNLNKLYDFGDFKFW